MSEHSVNGDSVNEEQVAINLPNGSHASAAQTPREEKYDTPTDSPPDASRSRSLSPEKLECLSRPSVRSKIRLVTVFDRPAPEKIKPMYNLKAYTRGIIDITLILGSFGLAIYLIIDRDE
jgi:hypothetical protein